MMLAYFPPLYEDELVYSWFARYHINSANISYKQTLKDLYGASSAIAVPDLPTNLDEVYKKLRHFKVPHVNAWIENHTLFRYYITFLSTEKKRKVFQAMKYGNLPGAIHMMTGIMASSIKESKFFRYCPSCLLDDFKMHGETYWRVSHQLPGVFICHKHQQVLHNSSVLFRNKNKHEFVAASKDNCQPAYNNEGYTNKTNKCLHVIAEQSIALLRQDLDYDLDNIRSAYRYLLHAHGYATFTGKVDQRKLAEQFVLYYGKEFLDMVQCSVSYDYESCWLKNISRKHRKSFHPIRHVLFIHFLGEDVSSFYNYSNMKNKPFGTPPYQCLNPACDNYRQKVIKNVDVTICSDTRRPVGTFECSCGFKYSRRGPDTCAEDAFKTGRIKQFGQTWMNRMKELIKIEDKSFYEASKILQCDVATVKKYFYKQETTNRESTATVFMNSQLKGKQEQWTALITRNLDKSVTELRNVEPALYAWHYRNNKDWLECNTPRQQTQVKRVNKVNWDERDNQILEEVKNTVNKLRSVDKPIYVNKSRVGKEIGKISILEKHLDKLPKTEKFLLENVESRQTFQIRRVRWACKDLHDKHKEFVNWRIVRLAGIKNLDDELQQVIDKEIAKYKEGDKNCKN